MLLTHVVLNAQEKAVPARQLVQSTGSVRARDSFVSILLAVASAQFITQQLLGNPLSSPAYECPYQQSWVATSQQNSASQSILPLELRWLK